MALMNPLALGIAPILSTRLYCLREQGPRQHRYAHALWHPGPTEDVLQGSLELVYTCRVCGSDRVLAVVILCGPRAPRDAPKRARGRPRMVRL